MTIYELLQTPLMRGAKVIAGHSGLHREVSWTAPDSDIDFDQWIMPGLLLLHTSTFEDVPWSDMSIKIEKANPSGIVLFSNTLTELMTYVIEVQMFSYYNEKRMPLILLPRGANMLDFSKRFFHLCQHNLPPNIAGKNGCGN